MDINKLRALNVSMMIIFLVAKLTTTRHFGWDFSLDILIICMVGILIENYLQELGDE